MFALWYTKTNKTLGVIVMKKIFFIFLSAFVLTACTRPSVTDYQNNQQNEITNDINQEEVIEAPHCNIDAKMEIPVDVQLSDTNLPLIYLTAEACQLVLTDFDYLAEIIIANMPAQVIAPSRLGMQMDELLNVFRDWIVNFEPIESLHSFAMNGYVSWGDTSPLPTDDRELAAHYLSSLLFWLSIEVDSLGHLSPRIFDTYWEQLEHAAASLHQSEIIDGRLFHDDELGWDVRLAQHRYDAFSTESTLWFFGVDMSDLDLYRELSDIGFREEENIITEIIENGHIAYFRIRNFSNSPQFDSEILFPFFAEIQDFDHLIIDLRSNPGGWAHYFTEYIVGMLIEEPVVAYQNEFFMSGDLSRQIAEYSLADWFGSAEEILSAREFVYQNDFPDFNYDDLTILTYVIPWRLVIEPRENNIPFSGKIWLLVNESSASASETAAVISMSSGFATVVGQNTMGVTGTMHTYISLPNTGILFRIDTGYTIDADGRQLERFGVTPDIILPLHDQPFELDGILEIIANW